HVSSHQWYVVCTTDIVATVRTIDRICPMLGCSPRRGGALEWRKTDRSARCCPPRGGQDADINGEGAPVAFDLDDIDRSIIAALVEDSRLSVRQLAERVHISRSAAHKRFTALVESGAIRKFTAEVDREALGMSVTAVVVVKIDERPWPQVREDLAALPFVEKVQAVSGDIDALVTVNAPDNTALSQVILQRIHEVPGVVSSRSLLSLAEAEGHRPGAG